MCIYSSMVYLNHGKWNSNVLPRSDKTQKRGQLSEGRTNLAQDCTFAQRHSQHLVFLISFNEISLSEGLGFATGF